MLITRLAKTAFVAAAAFLATLVAFGNITDYGTNFAFIRQVFMMESLLPGSTIGYRAIVNPMIHHVAYMLIITAQTLTALLCWIGAVRMSGHLRSDARAFDRSKGWAIGGLAISFLVWQVGFMSIGGEWFGMWMSEARSGIDSAFRFFMTMIAILIFVSLPEAERR